MRRRDREITDIDGIIEIIDECKVMRLAMIHDGKPYVVPLNFGYSYANGKFEFFFHCAKAGQKLDCIEKSPEVCFEMDCGHELVTADCACEYGYRYRSVIGEGHAELVTDEEEKKRYLSGLMRHQTGREFSFTNKEAEAVAVCRITVDKITAKAKA